MWIKFSPALVFVTLLLLTLAFMFMREYRQAGKRLLVLPMPQSQRFIFIALSVALSIIGFYSMPQETAEDLNNLDAAIGGGVLGGGTSFLMELLFPTELRENGIMFSGTLRKWSSIQSYEWQGNQCLFLKFKPRRWLHWHKKWKIRISPSKQELTEEILQEKFSNQD